METIELLQALYEAKAAENAAKARRMELEAKFAEAVGVPDEWEGSRTQTLGGFKVNVKRYMNVKVDSCKACEIASRQNLGRELEIAFRRKFELDKNGWKSIGEDAQTAFAEAITKTPGKVAVSVAIVEEKENNKEDK